MLTNKQQSQYNPTKMYTKFLKQYFHVH